jgi:hypothetical protein
MKQRQIMLAVALCATVVAAFLAPAPAEDLAAVRPAIKAAAPAIDHGAAISPTRSRDANNRGSGLVLLDIVRRVPDEEDAGVFSQVSWVPPTAKKSEDVKAEPSAPQAPPLPFKVIGQYAENGVEGVFLQLNDQYLVVRPGDTINATYKVASYKNGVLDIVYLPLDQHQTLVVSTTE